MSRERLTVFVLAGALLLGARSGARSLGARPPVESGMRSLAACLWSPSHSPNIVASPTSPSYSQNAVGGSRIIWVSTGRHAAAAGRSGAIRRSSPIPVNSSDLRRTSDSSRERRKQAAALYEQGRKQAADGRHAEAVRSF